MNLSGLDTKKPMQVRDINGMAIYDVTNILFQNLTQVFCEVRPKGWTPAMGDKHLYILFDRLTGRSYVDISENAVNRSDYALSMLQLENYEPGPDPVMTLPECAREFARSAHVRVGQMYDDNPYIFHVDMAADVAKEYRHLVPEEDFDTILAGIYLHDVSEDVHFITYNPLLKKFGKPVAEIAHALENEKGKNRKERANGKYYEGIRNTKGASFAKCCDRIANIRHGIAQDGHMVDGYRKEHHHFRKELFTERLRPMFEEMEKLLGL